MKTIGMPPDMARRLINERVAREREYMLKISKFPERHVDWCFNLVTGVKVGLVAIINTDQHCMNRVIDDLFPNLGFAGVRGEAFVVVGTGFIVITPEIVSDDVDLFSCEQIEEAINILRFNNVDYKTKKP